MISGNANDETGKRRGRDVVILNASSSAIHRLASHLNGMGTCLEYMNPYGNKGRLCESVSLCVPVVSSVLEHGLRRREIPSGPYQKQVHEAGLLSGAMHVSLFRGARLGVSWAL
jgi:hypothetical protein